MTLLALGINHNTATVAIRENLAFAVDEASDALRSARVASIASEMVILSTCNRTELYCEADVSVEAVIDWLAEYKGVSVEEVLPACYAHLGAEAIRHMMKVASGLDSLVLGEPQILGQMKSSYAHASEHDSLGRHLHAAFQQVFAAAKRVRSETAIGENPVSVAYAAVSLAKQIFSDLRKDTALLVGAGETVELLARHLHEQGIKKIYVANRTLSRAQALAAQFDGEALLLTSLPEYLPKADIVISSTASTLPLIGKGMVEQALKVRKHKPIFMVDIAVPRDIESQVGDLNDVFLYTVDDLKEVIDENKRSREQAAEIANDIIDEGVRKFEHEKRSLGSVDVIRSFRSHTQSLSQQELEKALRNLQSGQAPEEVLERLAHGLSNKFMHAPTQQLKLAAADNNHELAQSVCQLFDLPDSKSE